MKLTSKELKKIIKEELQNVLDEQTYSSMSNRAGDDGGEFLTPEEEKRRRDARVRRAIAADEKEKEIV